MTCKTVLPRALAVLLALVLVAALLPAPVLAKGEEKLLSDDASSYGLLSRGQLLPAEEPAAANRPALLAEGEEYDHAHDAEIIEAIRTRQPQLDVTSWSGLYVTNYKAILARIADSHPELYWLSTYNCNYYSSSGKVAYLHFYYDASGPEEDALFEAALDRTLRELDSLLAPSATDLEKALLIHDYLCALVAYDYANLRAGTLPDSVYSMYGTLVNRRAVCQGYSETYMYLLRHYGVPCGIATSNAANHAWNLVLLDGSWYHIDATWDDPVWDIYGRVNHNYVLLSTAGLLSLSSNRSDYVTMVPDGCPDYTEASDRGYETNQIWTGVSAQMVTDGSTGLWYYLKNGTLYSSSITGEGTLARFTLPVNRWPGSSASSYYSNQGRLVLLDGRIYLSGPDTIYVYSIFVAAAHAYYRADTASGYIYGLAEEDGILGYALETSPNLTGDQTFLPVPCCNAPDSVHIPGDCRVITPPTSFTDGILSSDCSVCGEAGSLSTIPPLAAGEYTYLLETNTYSWNDHPELTFAFVGDLNTDCRLTLLDVAILYSVYIGRTETALPLESLDLTADGKLNLLDVAALFRGVS